MEIIIYLLATLLGFFGLMFLVGSQGQPLRLFLGALLLLCAATLVFLFRTKPKSTTLVQKIDLSGDVGLEQLKCRSCGGSLGQESVSVRAGAVFVNCQYCGFSYQLEEEPKW